MFLVIWGYYEVLNTVSKNKSSLSYFSVLIIHNPDSVAYPESTPGHSDVWELYT